VSEGSATNTQWARPLNSESERYERKTNGQTIGFIGLPFGSLLRDRMLCAMAKGRGDMDWSAIALGATEDAD
jgi:hypothetical protein